jgi:putative peptidoglycan lipid II flippase
VGLALSIGLGACLNAWLLWRGLHTRGQYVAQPGWGKFLAKLLVALAVMVAVLSFITPVDARWIEMRATPWARLGWLMTVVIAGAAAYFAMLAALGFRLADFRRRG